MRLVLVLTVLLIFALGTGQTALSRDNESVTRIICKVFGPYCKQAKDVSWCESRWKPWAKNGQYLGLFQMGSSERATYGHGPGAWAQARAALRYFIKSGRDWSPWRDCKP